MKALILLPCASILIATNSRADSGVIQLQQIPNGKDETEGADFYPPGVDTNLVISSGVNTNGHGSVVMTRNGAIQDFLVVANNLAQGPNAFNFAYGVFINDFPGSTNFSLIGVMDLVRPGKKTTTWRLEYIGTNAAPPELGVADLGDLVGLELRIIGSPLNPSNANLVFLHAILPPVLPDPAVNSGVKRVAMSIPPAGLGSPPSPYAQGTLTVKYDAVRGRTVISIKATKLTHGTGYAVFLEDAPGAGVYQEIEEMNEPIKFPNTLSSGFLTLDTQKGNPIDFFAHTPNDLAGRNIVVVDPFFDAFAPTNSSIHLIATMPSIP
ncbi:MAG TPA: hypothetical protein VMV72_18415 [Verrucomicrobiae bacterium]|nr:hypothetical protein [Verrucomicrobiae bacterium]